MNSSIFFQPHDGVRLDELALSLGVELVDRAFMDRRIRRVAPVARASAGDLCYMVTRKHKDELQTCQASAILCGPEIQSLVPSHIAVLLTHDAHGAFAAAGKQLYPSALQPMQANSAHGISPQAYVDPSAHLEAGVDVDPMAVISAGVSIGAGTRIGAGVFIGPNVKIGRNCAIAGGASILCAYVGNYVIVHNGARIGQDGFGYAPGRAGLSKIAQIGRVIIQDHVEIGANTTIDRGTMDDTVIGEGTKIDNQVQIGHNVRIGRHCAIVAKVGIAGSTQIGDGVMIGGAAGLNGHITIGNGVQIAAMSGVVGSIPAGQKYGGNPARPFNDYIRDMLGILNSAGKRKRNSGEHND